MARTKRTARTTRKSAATSVRLETLKARAAATVGTLIERGTALQKHARNVIAARAEIVRDRAAGAVSHMEKVFEQRVHRAVSKLGVPSTRDVRALSRQVAQLQQSVDSLRRSRARA